MELFDDEVEQVRKPPCFVLAPLNSAARKATEHVRNKYWQHSFDASSQKALGLWIDFTDPDKNIYTLGRKDTDIYLPEGRSSHGSPQISDIHAAFELVQETGAVLLRDYSDHGNTEPFALAHSSSPNHAGVTVKFLPGTSSVLVARGINSRIAFGRDRFYQFEIQWRSDGLYAFEKDEPYTLGPRPTRAKRYLQGERVGGGSFGTVWSVLDITTGSVMAVKKFHSLSGKRLEFATREVANLFRINEDNSIQHEHILQIFDYAGGGEKDNWGEIFMPLKKGNLKKLVETTDYFDVNKVAKTALRQMLLALECIASHNIVHRDIKPENVLWDHDANGDLHFCLGDFGLSNSPELARTVAGTEPFMAPEVYHRQKQSTKVDIWSLFSTIVWVHNTNGFRDSCAQFGAQDIHVWLVQIAQLPKYEKTRRMARINPKKRPSASQQLAILDGEGDEELGDVGGGDEEDGLSDHFSQMTLGGDSGVQFGAGSASSHTLAEIPYYEPYTTGLMDGYPWEDGPSKPYLPAPVDSADAARDRQAFVALHGNPYGPPEDNDNMGTAVPGMRTTQPILTEEEPPRGPKGKHKGKHKQVRR